MPGRAQVDDEVVLNARPPCRAAERALLRRKLDDTEPEPDEQLLETAILLAQQLVDQWPEKRNDVLPLELISKSQLRLGRIREATESFLAYVDAVEARLMANMKTRKYDSKEIESFVTKHCTNLLREEGDRLLRARDFAPALIYKTRS